MPAGSCRRPAGNGPLPEGLTRASASRGARSWNAYIGAEDYWSVLYPSKSVDRYLSVVYFFPNVVTSIVVVRFGQRLRTSTRLHIGFWIFAVCLIIIPLIDGAGIQQDATGAAIGSWSWYVTLVTAGLTGCADAIAQGSLFGMAANMPERYTAAGFTGTAASGVIAQLVRIITKGSLPQTVQGLIISSYIYFAVAVLITLACIFTFSVLLPKLPITLYYLADALPEKADTLADLNSTSMREMSIRASARGSLRSVLDSVKAAELNDAQIASSMSLREQFAVFKKIWIYPISMVLLYATTLFIYPGVLAYDVSSERMGSWYAILLMLIYNVGDMLGKLLTGFVLFGPKWFILSGTLVRGAAFIPAFYFLAHFNPQGSGAEALAFLMTLAFGMSNGYLTSAAFATAPRGLKRAEAELTGLIMVLGLLTGLCAGAFSSWLWEL